MLRTTTGTHRRVLSRPGIRSKTLDGILNKMLNETLSTLHRSNRSLRQSEPMSARSKRSLLRDHLATVQRQSEWPTRATQAFQAQIQRRIVAPALNIKAPVRLLPPATFHSAYSAAAECGPSYDCIWSEAGSAEGAQKCTTTPHFLIAGLRAKRPPTKSH